MSMDWLYTLVNIIVRSLNTHKYIDACVWRDDFDKWFSRLKNAFEPD